MSRPNDVGIRAWSISVVHLDHDVHKSTASRAGDLDHLVGGEVHAPDPICEFSGALLVKAETARVGAKSGQVVADATNGRDESQASAMGSRCRVVQNLAPQKSGAVSSLKVRDAPRREQVGRIPRLGTYGKIFLAIQFAVFDARTASEILLSTRRIFSISSGL